MVSSVGVKRILCDPRVWSDVKKGDTRAERVAYANLNSWETIADVPDKFRLKNFIPEYEDVPLMDIFIDEYKPDLSERVRKYKYHRVRRAVEEYIDNGHYAFLTPKQVDGFFETVTEYKLRVQYQVYLSVLRTFYEWMIWHRQYPHTYNPIDMAILHNGTVHDLIEKWLDYKNITQNNE